MHGDRFSARWVEPDPKTSSTSFGLMADPPDLPDREDVLVENGAASPKSCFPSFKMRTTAAAGGLLATGKTSTPKNTTFNEPSVLLDRGGEVEGDKCMDFNSTRLV